VHACLFRQDIIDGIVDIVELFLNLRRKPAGGRVEDRRVAVPNLTGHVSRGLQSRNRSGRELVGGIQHVRAKLGGTLVRDRQQCCNQRSCKPTSEAH
jgi:hypothetical protein